VTIELSGYRTQTLPIEIKKDATVPLDVALTREGSGGGGGKRSSVWLGVAGVGAAALIGGVALIVLDEDPAPTEPEYFDSAPGGYALVGVAVAAVVAGTVLYLKSGKAPARTATAWIDPGRGGGVAVAGRF
jgi:hypothetical protein